MAVAYAPSVVEAEIGDSALQITLETDYPFKEELRFRIQLNKPTEFPLRLRIPSWTTSPRLSVNNEEMDAPETGTFHRIARTWRNGDIVRLFLPMSTETEHRFNNAVSLTRGPLLYSLNIDEDWRKIGGEEPHADWEVHPGSKWNYAIEINFENPEESVHFESKAVGKNPFSSAGAPVKLTVSGRLLPSWTLSRNAAAAPPKSPVESAEPLVQLELVPYGATKLRITEFPWLR